MSNTSTLDLTNICQNCTHQDSVQSDGSFMCKLLDENISKVILECEDFEEFELDENNQYECE